MAWPSWNKMCPRRHDRKLFLFMLIKSETWKAQSDDLVVKLFCCCGFYVKKFEPTNDSGKGSSIHFPYHILQRQHVSYSYICSWHSLAKKNWLRQQQRWGEPHPWHCTGLWAWHGGVWLLGCCCWGLQRYVWIPEFFKDDMGNWGWQNWLYMSSIFFVHGRLRFSRISRSCSRLNTIGTFSEGIRNQAPLLGGFHRSNGWNACSCGCYPLHHQPPGGGHSAITFVSIQGRYVWDTRPEETLIHQMIIISFQVDPSWGLHRWIPNSHNPSGHDLGFNRWFIGNASHPKTIGRMSWFEAVLSCCTMLWWFWGHIQEALKNHHSSMEDLWLGEKNWGWTRLGDYFKIVKHRLRYPPINKGIE